MFGRFLKHYGKNKLKQSIQALNDAIVSFDPDGATEAAIEEMEENFDKINREFSKARAEWLKEQQEADQIVELYNKRLAAAEKLKQQLDQQPDNVQLQSSLTTLVDALEDMAEDVQVEQEEAADAKEVMEELEQVVTMYAEKLKTARRDMKKAVNAMKKAQAAERRAQQKAERAAVSSGLKSSVGGLSSALDAMNRKAAEAKNNAEAAARKADLLGPTTLEDDPLIAEAMEGSSSTSAESVADRLSRLSLRR